MTCGSPVSFFKSRHGWRLLFPVSAALKHKDIRVSGGSVMCSGTGENRFHSVRTPDGCCGRQKVRLGVTADRGCVTVNWKRHGRLFEAARVHVRAQLLPNTPEPLSHDQSPSLPTPTSSPPSPVLFSGTLELRCSSGVRLRASSALWCL